MTTTTSRYEARLRLTFLWVLFYLPAMWVFAASAVAVTILLAVSMSEPPTPGAAHPFMLWAWLVFLLVSASIFCHTVLSWTIGFATKRVALRVDEAGVTFGRGPYLLDRRVTVPWIDLDRIVLFEHHMHLVLGYQPFIGLRLRPGAVRPRGVPEPGSFRARRNRYPAEVSRQVAGWDLDVGQLYEAVQVHGPHVPVVNIGRHSG